MCQLNIVVYSCNHADVSAHVCNANVHCGDVQAGHVRAPVTLHDEPCQEDCHGPSKTRRYTFHVADMVEVEGVLMKKWVNVEGELQS